MIEAIEEGKRVAAYFETEEQAMAFVKSLADLKDTERKGFGLEQIEQASKMQRSEHPVITSRAELSKRIAQGGKESSTQMLGAENA